MSIIPFVSTLYSIGIFYMFLIHHISYINIYGNYVLYGYEIEHEKCKNYANRNFFKKKRARSHKYFFFGSQKTLAINQKYIQKIIFKK